MDNDKTNVPHVIVKDVGGGMFVDAGGRVDEVIAMLAAAVSEIAERSGMSQTTLLMVIGKGAEVYKSMSKVTIDAAALRRAHKDEGEA